MSFSRRRATRTLAFVICTSWVGISLSPQVGAQPSTASPDAPQPPRSLAERFAEAQALFDAADHASALPLFQALTAESGSPNARLYLARCLRELGRTTEAYDEMSATVREATAKAQSEAKYAQTRDASASELALLQAQVAHLVLATTEATPPSGITVNGLAVDLTHLGSPVTVLPGHLIIEISRRDRPTERREIDIQASQTKTVALGAPEKQDKPAPPPDETTGGALRWVGVAVGAAGVISFAAFAGTAVTANARYSDVEEACGGVRCTDPKYADTIDEGKRLDTAATATLVVGSILVAGAIPMIIFGGPQSVESKVSISVGPAHGSVAWTTTF